MKNRKSILVARLVLEDCRWAISNHTETLSGEALRVSWVSIVTLLRAVGHVLEKVDAVRDSDVAEVVREEWKKPRPENLFRFYR